MVGNNTTGKIRLIGRLEAIVKVLLDRPLADLSDFGVIDLYLIERVCCSGRERRARISANAVGALDLGRYRTRTLNDVHFVTLFGAS